MKEKTIRRISGILGVLMVVPGLAKFREPFKTFILQHLNIIGVPFSEVIQYLVKVSEIGIGLSLLLVAFSKPILYKRLIMRVMIAAHFFVIFIMLIAVYTHLHPDVPAQILPFEYKPPAMPVGYILIAWANLLFIKNNSYRSAEI